MKTGYIWYDLLEQEIEGTKVVFSFCFKNAFLESVSLCLTDIKYGQGWNDWSESKEKLRSNDTKKLLTDLGYPPNNYSWGEVWAYFDPKSGQGTGGIRYKNQTGTA